VSLLLVWLGGAAVAISLIIGLQALAVPRLAADFGRPALVIPAWGVSSLVFAFVLRRNAQNRALKLFGVTWFLIGLVALAWLARA